MEKLKMQTENVVQSNIEYIASKFPNCVVESKDAQGKTKQMIDFDLLKQELSSIVVDESKERYQMTWPDKKQAIVNANKPTTSTLRPCREESVNYENTENIYIEGDNLEVLKVLRQTYMHKVKMIYIDPPYNTGNDFIYKDNFAKEKEEYLEESGQIDEDGNRMFKNTESSGRYHTDWLNMIYPRLRVAKDLLTDDGVIFISIDDNEVHNLRKVCDEIFGESNFVCDFIRKTSYGEKTAKHNINKHHDFIICYTKTSYTLKHEDIFKGETKNFENYSNPDNDPNGEWTKDSLLIKIDNGRYGYARYPITNHYLGITHYPPVVYDENNKKQWHYIESTFREMEKRGQVVYYKNKNEYSGEYSFFIKKYKKDCNKNYNNISTLFTIENQYTNTNGTKDFAKIFENGEFKTSYPKPVELVKKLIQYVAHEKEEAIILDFFSGSATTAHAAMQLNAENLGGGALPISVNLY